MQVIDNLLKWFSFRYVNILKEGFEEPFPFSQKTQPNHCRSCSMSVSCIPLDFLQFKEIASLFEQADVKIIRTSNSRLKMEEHGEKHSRMTRVMLLLTGEGTTLTKEWHCGTQTLESITSHSSSWLQDSPYPPLESNRIESNQNQIPTSLDVLRKMRPSLSTMRMAVAGSVIKDEKASANGFLRNTTRSAKAPGATTPTSPSMLKSWAHVVVAERSTDAGLWTRHRSENSSSWCLCMPPNKSLPKQMFTPWFSANASASKPLPRRSLTCHIHVIRSIEQ